MQEPDSRENEPSVRRKKLLSSLDQWQGNTHVLYGLLLPVSSSFFFPGPPLPAPPITSPWGLALLSCPTFWSTPSFFFFFFCAMAFLNPHLHIWFPLLFHWPKPCPTSSSISWPHASGKRQGPRPCMIHWRILNDKSPVCSEQRLERKLILHDLEKKKKKKRKGC